MKTIIGVTPFVETKMGYFEVSLDQERHWLVARIEFGDPRLLFLVVERIRAMFDLNADWSSIAEILESDAVLARTVRENPGLRVAGCWDGFELATRAILGQQITVSNATALAGRLTAEFGKRFCGPAGLTHLFPGPEILADANLTAAGITGPRAQTIRTVARAICDGRISFVGVVNSDAFLKRLREIPGIGDWTAQYVAMRALGEPDAFPSTDLGLLRAMNFAKSNELERLSQAWRPWRAYAAMYLWKYGKPLLSVGNDSFLTESHSNSAGTSANDMFVFEERSEL